MNAELATKVDTLEMTLEYLTTAADAVRDKIRVLKLMDDPAQPAQRRVGLFDDVSEEEHYEEVPSLACEKKLAERDAGTQKSKKGRPPYRPFYSLNTVSTKVYKFYWDRYDKLKVQTRMLIRDLTSDTDATFKAAVEQAWDIINPQELPSIANVVWQNTILAYNTLQPFIGQYMPRYTAFFESWCDLKCQANTMVDQEDDQK